MGQWYPYSTKWEKSVVTIIHIYGAIAIFLLLYDDQDTVSTDCEIRMKISQLLSTSKYISKDIWDNAIHTLKNGRKILWQFFIFMELEPFLNYFIMTKTLKKSNRKYK